MGEMRVRGAGDHRAAQRLELRHPLGEGDDLGGADEGEVERVEEEDDVLSFVVVQAHLFKVSVYNSLVQQNRRS